MLFLTVAALIGAYNLHWLLLGCPDAYTLDPMTALSGLNIRTVLLFFLIFTAAGATLVFYMLFSRSYIKYKSDMQHVTPDIQTPKAEGQGQYGTARWLQPGDFGDAFHLVVVDAHSDLIRLLMEHGQDDLRSDP